MKFEDAWRICSKLTIMPEADARAVWAAGQACPGGEFWECGTYLGGTALMMKMADPERRIRVFDTFTGLPEWGEKDTTPIPAPELADTSAEAVEVLIAPQGKVYPGLVPETLSGFAHDPIGVLHLDMDLYEPTIAALRELWPRMLPGGVILVHDYGFSGWGGINSAVDEFCKEIGEPVWIGPTGWHARIQVPK